MTTDTPPLISSQRYLDHAKVQYKALTFKVFIVRTVDLALRGTVYRLLIDGHHNLAAARLAGKEPTWKGPPNKFQRIRARMNPADFAQFLINNLTDSDWYFVETGAPVEALLGRE